MVRIEARWSISENGSSMLWRADGVRVLWRFRLETKDRFGDQKEEHGKEEQSPCFSGAFFIVVFASLLEEGVANAFEQRIDGGLVQRFFRVFTEGAVDRKKTAVGFFHAGKEGIGCELIAGNFAADTGLLVLRSGIFRADAGGK